MTARAVASAGRRWLRRRKWLGVAQIETGYMLAPTAAYLLTVPSAAVVGSGGGSSSRWSAFVDTGPAAGVGRLLEALELCGREPADVQAIVLTHCHLDSAGGAAALAEHCPNAVIIAHPRSCRHLADPSRLVAKAQSLYGASAFDELFGVCPLEPKAHSNDPNM